MSYRIRDVLKFVAVVAAVGLLASCAREKLVRPASAIGPGGAEGLTAEQAGMEHRTVSGQDPNSGIDKWYAKAGRPRILTLFNRRFSGDEQKWRSNSRVVWTSHRGETERPAGQDPATVTEREKEILKGETRIQGPGAFIDPETAARLHASFQKPLIAAGCRLVDPAAVERIAQAAASKVEGPEGVRPAIDISTDAFLKEADWIIEVIPIPSRVPANPLFLSAKVVELKSRRILALASTREMIRKPRLPGAVKAGVKRVPVEDQSSWLVEELSRQLSAETNR